MASEAARGKSVSEREAWVGNGAPFAGKYAVGRLLGQGGMGTVFEARHIRLGHRVAIKVLGTELRDCPELVVRFEREARASRLLTSRHAVRVFDIDVTEDGTPFIVMELLSGRDLARVIDGDGPQPVGRAVAWLIDACDAIAEAHANGIVHRDLKPSNLFLSDDGVKVLDFGVAKRISKPGEASLTQSIAPLGTPHYMSPEQVRCARDVDARTDIWSLGVTLYELVTGRTPFAEESPTACIAAIAADPVPDPREFRPDLPGPLVAVMMRALCKQQSQRYGTIAELALALAPFADADADVASGVQSVLSSAPRPKVGESPTQRETVHRPRSRGNRGRSSLAIASAGLIGLAALVATPKCVAPAGSAPMMQESRAPAASHASSPAAATSPMSDAASPRVVAATVPATRESSQARTLTAKNPRLPLTTTKSLHAATPVSRRVGDDSPNPVHGGLSSPGF